MNVAHIIKYRQAILGNADQATFAVKLQNCPI